MLSAQAATKDSEIVVKLVHHKPCLGLPTRYLRAGRVNSFTLTQPLLVDKEPIFDLILNKLASRMKAINPDRPLRILDIGCGPAFVIDRLVEVANGHHIHYVGIDLSKEMTTSVAQSQSLHQRRNMEFELHSGINVPVEGLVRAFQQNIERRFDAIFSLQFSHYLPTTLISPLGIEYSEHGLHPICRDTFWRQCFTLLDRGGMFFDFDDVVGKDDSETRELEREWDWYGLQRMTDPRALAAIGTHDVELYRRIKARYVDGVPLKLSLERFAKARRERRLHDREEPASLDFIATNLDLIFDELLTYRHPDLRKFYLWMASKSS